MNKFDGTTDDELESELDRRKKAREQGDAAAKAACEAFAGPTVWENIHQVKDDWRRAAEAARGVPPSDEVLERMVNAACIAGDGYPAARLSDGAVAYFRRLVLAALKEFK